MAFRTDGGGFAFACTDAKLQPTGPSTYGTKLSQLHRMEGAVRIITYSLPRVEYVKRQIGRRPTNIYLIAHEQFIDRALAIKAEFPDIRISVHPKVHDKILLIEPSTVVVSSANFGDSDWSETSVSFHSKPAHDWYVQHRYEPLWAECREVTVEALRVR